MGAAARRPTAAIAGTGIGLVRFDKAGQHVEEERALLWRERRQDAFLRGASVGAQPVAQGLAARRQAQRAGAPVLWIYPPLDIAGGGEAMDEVMGAHRIDAQPGRQAALVDGRCILERSDHGVLDRRQAGAFGNLCGDAETDLMEAPRQMGGDPVTLWNVGCATSWPCSEHGTFINLFSKLIICQSA